MTHNLTLNEAQREALSRYSWPVNEPVEIEFIVDQTHTFICLNGCVLDFDGEWVMKEALGYS